MRWVGIDEAGYGPNLGPLVMTAVVAESTAPAASSADGFPTLDLWGDLATSVDRAGGDPTRLWVDDSKAILHGGQGRDRLELACLAAIHAAGHPLPRSMRDLLEVVGAGTLTDAELSPWLEAEEDERPWFRAGVASVLQPLLEKKPLEPDRAGWRLAAIRSVIVGPARFNAELASSGSKAEVHFSAFARLLDQVWDRASDGVPTSVRGDKHGGRHYYLGPLGRCFPEAWIDRGPEGPELSRYTIRAGDRRLELSLVPRAERCDGLVALASIVSKTIREAWMDVFNAYWHARVPGLRPTAGYPLDANRFRREIEAVASAQGWDPGLWWRVK